VLAAARYGLKEVILPESNKADWLDVPAEVRCKLKAHFVGHIADVLRLALETK
jgi:ATP-dependent Lon protease